MEPDARDVVARAIENGVSEGRGTDNGGIYLDITHHDADFIQERLPRMYERFQDLGVNMAEEPVEVAPTTHYGMGGVAVDDHGETDVNNLFAIGETMSGVHGVNQLGGNSLAEPVAYGVATGTRVADRVDGPGAVPSHAVENLVEPHLSALDSLTDSDGTYNVDTVIEDFRACLWEHAGILRDDTALAAGLSTLTELPKKYPTVLSARSRASRSSTWPISDSC